MVNENSYNVIREEYGGRIPAVIDARNPSEGFIISTMDGVKKVKLIEVIGRGGTGIAYKGVERCSNGQNIYIAKEYYPITSDTSAPLKYQRKKIGGDLHIVATDGIEDCDIRELVKKELETQADNIELEKIMSQALRSEESTNNSHVFKVEDNVFYRLNSDNQRADDSSFLLVDTVEGCTLRTFIDERPREKEGLTSILGLFESILFALKSLLRAEDGTSPKYLHGDLKPSNIYLAGLNDPRLKKFEAWPIILDFGSAFSYDDYRTDDIKSLTDDEIIEKANKIISNNGLGCSSNGYRSYNMYRFMRAKEDYQCQKNIKRAKPLIASMNRLGISVDAFSIVQIWIEMLTGKIFPDEGSLPKDVFSDYSSDVVDFIQFIGKKNQEEKYQDLQSIEKDLEQLKTIVNNGAHPNVLLKKLREEFSQNHESTYKQIDDRLFGEISPY